MEVINQAILHTWACATPYFTLDSNFHIQEILLKEMEENLLSEGVTLSKTRLVTSEVVL